MPEFRRVASVGSIPPGKGAVLEIGGKKIAVFNVEGVFYTIDNACTHRGGPLGEGNLQGRTVNCPWHGAQFNVINGKVVSPPAPTGVSSYPTKEEGSIWVVIS